jgi:hypothetical protein
MLKLTAYTPPVVAGYFTGLQREPTDIKAGFAHEAFS